MPLADVSVIAQLLREHHVLIRLVALTVSGITLVFALGLVSQFDPAISSLQFFEQYRWNPRLGTSFALGIDGFSFPKVLLATLLCFVALLASNSIQQRIKGYYLLTLLLESAMLGVFMASRTPAPSQSYIY